MIIDTDNVLLITDTGVVSARLTMKSGKVYDIVFKSEKSKIEYLEKVRAKAWRAQR